jgi:uncharacterized membrane protein YfcA
MALPFDLTPAAAAWIALVMFGAAFVRGYSGFGFAALMLTGAGLVTSPYHLMPVVVFADVVMTAGQLRGIWSKVDWRRAMLLLAGALPGVPIGVWLMLRIGPDTGRAVISVFILMMCGLLLSGWRMQRQAGQAANVGVGLASGLANGAAIGGLPVVAFFSAQPIAAAMFRATVIVYFTLMDLWTIPVMGASGMIERQTFVAVLFGLPVMLAGLWLGGRRFHATNPEGFRRFAIVLLAALAALNLIKALA